MERTLEAKLSVIEDRLMCEDINFFKIGKSNDSRARFNQHNSDEEFWHFLSIIARGSAESVNQAECDLIDYFRQHPTLKDKCQNDNRGGGGNEQATELYIIASNKYADPLEHLLGAVDLFTFETINI